MGESQNSEEQKYSVAKYIQKNSFYVKLNMKSKILFMEMFICSKTINFFKRMVETKHRAVVYLQVNLTSSEGREWGWEEWEWEWEGGLLVMLHFLNDW